MLSEAELLKAINELEKAPSTFQDVEKLATFYILYDHLYKRQEPAIEPIKEVTINRYNGSEFYHAISGKKASDVWRVMNDVMGMIRAIQPRIYRAILQRISKL